jgi:REP element-mobilizing transposase RayT
LTGEIKELVEVDINKLCEWKGCEVLELNVHPDHIHLVVSIPPEEISIFNDGDIEREDCDKTI